MAKRKTAESGNGKTFIVLSKDGSISLSGENDYKKTQGSGRNIIKEFEKLRTAKPFASHFLYKAACQVIPSVRILRLASESDALFSEDGRSLKVEDGIHDLLLKAVKDEDGMYSFEFSLHPTFEKVEIMLDGMVSAGGSLYEVREDLEELEDLERLSKEKVGKENLPLFFSMLLSSHNFVRIECDGYKSQRRKPVQAIPSLIFKNVDQYGYLHVVALSHVDGLPSEIINKNDLLECVKLIDEERILEIREIVYGEDPRKLFEKMLGRYPKNAVYEEDGNFIIDGPFASEFIQSHILQMMKAFNIYHGEILSKYKIRYSRPRINFHFTSGIDFLEGSASVDVADGISMSLDEFLSSYDKNEGYLLLSDKSKAYIDEEFIRKLERLIRKKNGKNVISSYDLPYLESLDDVKVDGDAIKGIRDFYTGLGELEGRKYSTKLKTSSLRDYQREGYRWLRYLHDFKMGGCLADEMGLGKTVQIIALLNDVFRSSEGKPSLLVAPKSIIYNWLDEIERFGIDLKPFVYYGQNREAEEMRKLKGGLVISSYATIRNDIGKIADMEFYYVILDESQNVKHFNTKTAHAILNLKSEHRLAVSGTPVENDLGELYSLFRFLNPALFPVLSEFEKEFVRPITLDDDKDALQMLKMKIHPFILRRMKKDVLKDLPQKTEQTVCLDMQKEHWDYYEERRKTLKSQIDGSLKKAGLEKSMFIILQALTELRQIAALPEGKMITEIVSSKREYLKQVLPEITQAGHKALVFTSFLDTVGKIGEDLEELGIGFVTMTGATRDRESLVSRFQSDENTKVFVMTLKTGGVGLNLTAADYVFIFDPWWNAAAEDQAINRTHRIGQSNPVFCYRLIAKGTIEEKILELQEKKRELSNALISSDGVALKSLSEEEIKEIFS